MHLGSGGWQRKLQLFVHCLKVYNRFDFLFFLSLFCNTSISHIEELLDTECRLWWQRKDVLMTSLSLAPRASQDFRLRTMTPCSVEDEVRTGRLTVEHLDALIASGKTQDLGW